MTGWTEKRLGDCVTFLSGGTPSRSNPEFWSGEIPWASNKDMKVGRLHETVEHISVDAAESSSKLVPTNTLLLVVRGMALAKMLPIAITQRTMAFNQDLKALKPKEGVSGAFLYYWFVANADFVLSKADEAAHGTKRLQTPTLEDLIVRLPKDSQEQEQIVSHLASIDDWIENCERRIQMLEEAARLIYTEWFANYRFPGHAKTECAPTTWSKGFFHEVADLIGGGTPSTDRADYWDGDIRWVTPTDITRNDSLALLDTQRKITEQGLEYSNARLLPPRSILMTSRASIGYFALSDDPVCTNQGFISLVPHTPEFRYYLLFNLMARRDEIESLATGATFKEISKKTFRTLPLLMPNQELLQAFNAIIEPMIDQIFTLKRQLAALRQARDLLLPRLISGQLRL